MLRDRRKEKNGFETRLYKTWKKPLDLLEMFWVIAVEVGTDFNHHFRQDASLEQDYVFDVLTHLHARACQITSEILTLLDSCENSLCKEKNVLDYSYAITNRSIRSNSL